MRYLLLLTTWIGLAFGCQKSTRFELMSAKQTGIDFENTITESDSMNVLDFEYIYNGGGVGVGDVNGDGRTDVFFAGNMVSSKLYLNQGDFTFQDITQPAGVTTSAWCTGVALVDINQDGRLDIYVSTVHPSRTQAVPNLLFINQGNDANGIPRFKEMAQEAGLADLSYSTQAAFFDYDLDGDLDCFLLTNALESYNRNNVTGPRNDGSAKSVDKLYRNDSDPANGPQARLRFTDISREAGIIHEGWGLGVIVNDVNQDGWPDIYVANDFQSNDVLYLNNGPRGNSGPTFTNRIADVVKHQSHNSMGVDMADINNDGLNDLAVVDMLPNDNMRQKTMFSMVNYDRFQMAKRLGYQPQYMRNVLQLNQGMTMNGRVGETNGSHSSALPLFSDIGYLAGVAATDWSWSALFADFDNDGYRDLLITNGYRKDVTDLDFSNFNRDATMFGHDQNQHEKLVAQIEKVSGVYKPKFIYRNNSGDPAQRLTFTDKAAEWGLDQPSYANGTAYADFDNDGDLDLVMNNINDRAFIYRNHTQERKGTESGHPGNYLRIRLQGDAGNPSGLGAKISLFYNGQQQYAEQVVQRGYQSTVEQIVHFGLGATTRIDSMKIVWPGGMGQLLTNVPANQLLAVSKKNARQVPDHFLTNSRQPAPPPLFREVSAPVGLAFRSDEMDFVDYKMQQTTLPQKHSQIGPGVAVGDVNGDGLDDLYLAGAAYRSGTLFLQQANATFRPTSLPIKAEEETGVLLFDADNDGDLDLYAVSGSTEYGKDTVKYQSRLYVNDGKGRFQSDSTALPMMGASGSCVVAADYDRDGDLDLFVGGRIVPREYPRAARSYLLRNNTMEQKAAGPTTRQPLFTDVTAQLAPALARPGLVCAALWTDTDNDNWPDLMLTGEWMPILVFKNNRGRSFSASSTHQTGWWNSLTAGDFDNDGDMDYIAGNVGLNTRYKASEKEPISVYANDYDKNGSLDPILAYYNGGKEYPIHPRETLTDQIPALKQKFLYFSIYGRSTINDVVPESNRQGAIILRATNFSSVYLENNGKGSFTARPLPIEAQFSPLFGAVPVDFNHDGNLDVLAVGNSYASEVLTGWYDAGIGVCLQGDGRGNFTSIPLGRSGFLVDGDAKGLAEVALKNGQSLYVATQNQDSLRVFRPTSPTAGSRVSLRPDDWFATIRLKNGRTRKVEFYRGSTYLSQSTRLFMIPAEASSVTITGRQGSRTIRN